MANRQLFRVYIQAAPDAVWQAITDADWTERYGYRARTDYELRAGGRVVSHANQEMLDYGQPAVVVDGEILEADAPKKLVYTFHAYFSDETVAEPGVIVSWLIDPDDHGLTRLTVVTEENDSPITMNFLAGLDATLGAGGGGYPFILSDLKTLLETGSSLPS